jgi:hypothetical protein
MLPGKVTFMGLPCGSTSEGSCQVPGSLMLDLQGSEKNAVASVAEQAHHGKQLLDLAVSQNVAAIIDAGTLDSSVILRPLQGLCRQKHLSQTQKFK